MGRRSTSWPSSSLTLRPLTLTTATDGNHGRAVAHMAALLGFDARIYVPDDMVPARIEAIEGEGAEVVVVDGTYDEAVAAAAASGDVVVADTGEGDGPRWVIEGYSTMFRELGDRRFDAVVLPRRCRRAGRRGGHRVPPRRDRARGGAGGGCAVPGQLPPAGRGVDPARHAPHDHVGHLLRDAVAHGVADRVPRRRLGRHRRRRPGPGGDAGAGGRGHRVRRDGCGGAGGPARGRESADGPELGDEVLVISTEGATDPVAYAEIVGP